MNEGRNHEMFMTGLNLSRLGLSPNEIEAELFAVVGAEPHMRRKIPARSSHWKGMVAGRGDLCPVNQMVCLERRFQPLARFWVLDVIAPDFRPRKHCRCPCRRWDYH